MLRFSYTISKICYFSCAEKENIQNEKKELEKEIKEKQQELETKRKDFETEHKKINEDFSPGTGYKIRMYSCDFYHGVRNSSKYVGSVSHDILGY